ncbi:hypothetical protein WA026_016531 [Henosepilachna vigintioctopunctata]|uniref:J domain-containing protein n=1 Tax=Henosepilachna vigintioctopunctata TaxID=420089 RepID=A0AAW1VHJ0_9CUCU
MSDFKESCLQYFGNSDFYEILKIKKDASQKEIQKAYYKLSLLVHPDRAEANDKLIATEKFKVLGKIHSILQDKEKRKVYDDCGEYDEEEHSTFNWMEYWRSLFKKISIEDIENFEKEYIGSETELRDIKKAYILSKGDMDVMLGFIPFSNCDSEPRIIEIVREMVEKGEVEEYKRFFSESARKKKRRHQKYEREKKEVEKESMADLDKIANEIQQRCSDRFMNMISSIEAKHGNKRKSIKQGEEAKPKKKRSKK